MKMFNRKICINIIIVFLFFVIGYTGVHSYKDYGVSFDESDTLYNAEVTIKYMQNIFTDIFTDNEVDYTPYEEYKWASNGCAIRYPIYLFANLKGIETWMASYIKLSHIYCFFIYFISLICFYKLLRMIFKSKWMSILGVLCLFLTPRIFAESFYNLKDNTFLAIFIINMYVLARAYIAPSRFNRCLFYIVSALCINTRIYGGIVFAIGIVMISISQKGLNKIKQFVVGSLITFVFFYMLTPYIWVDTFDSIISLIVYNLSFPYPGETLYNGTVYLATDLPWHYMFGWIAITTPLLILIYSCLGCLFSGFNLTKNGKRLEKEDILLLMSVCILICICILDIIIRPVDYDEWRHFRFIYPLMIISAIHFINQMRKYKFIGICIQGMMIVQLLYLTFWIWDNHPYEYMFFNIPSRSIAQTKYERDYWDVSFRDAIVYTLDNGDYEGVCKIYAPLEVSRWIMTDDQKDRLEFVTVEECQYYIESWRCKNPYESRAEMLDNGWNVFYTKYVDDILMYEIYER